MTKPKHDRLLSALIAKMPAESEWPRAGRIAWLQMMAMAFDVVYGPCGGIPVARGAAGDNAGSLDDARGGITPHRAPAEHCAAPPCAPDATQRFYVDGDGFAMADGRPIAMEELPAGAILWDERTGIECGDASAILWRDIGASRRSLPGGVTLRRVFDQS